MLQEYLTQKGGEAIDKLLQLVDAFAIFLRMLLEVAELFGEDLEMGEDPKKESEQQ